MQISKQLFIGVFIALFFITGLLSFPAGVLAAITVSTTDIIPDASRANFVGFEGMTCTDACSPLWTEDGVKVEQINGDGNDIWTIYEWGQDGSRSWYPSSGDNGYTKISLVSGQDMNAIGMLVGTGWSSSTTFYVQYALLNDGSIVAQGEIMFTSGYPQYLGFSGGGFDTVLLSGTISSGYTVTDGHYQALSIDSIEIDASTNEPPETPVLTSPASGSNIYGSSVKLFWQTSADPEGGNVTYRLQIAEDSGFTVNLQEYNVDENGVVITEAMLPFFALIGWGMINRRRQALSLMIAVLLLTSVIITGCGSGGTEDPSFKNSVSYTVTGLASGKTYYWRVIAVDEDNATSDPSETWSFTTNS